jgi:hypothetical protein
MSGGSHAIIKNWRGTSVEVSKLDLLRCARAQGHGRQIFFFLKSLFLPAQANHIVLILIGEIKQIPPLPWGPKIDSVDQRIVGYPSHEEFFAPRRKFVALFLDSDADDLGVIAMTSITTCGSSR